MTKYQVFTKLLKISHIHKIHNWKKVDHLLLPNKSYGRAIQIIYFLIFVRLWAVNKLQLVTSYPGYTIWPTGDLVSKCCWPVTRSINYWDVEGSSFRLKFVFWYSWITNFLLYLKHKPTDLHQVQLKRLNQKLNCTLCGQ